MLISVSKQVFGSSIIKALGVDTIPFGNDIVLTGPAGVGKSVFCTNLTSECLSQNPELNVIYATFDSAPKEIRTRISEQDPEKHDNLEKLIFVDGYSWLLGEVNENYHVSHLSNLNDLSVKIYNAINEKNGHNHILIFDSVSTLFVYNAENEVIRFLQTNMARVKQSESIAFWTVGENIHTTTFYNFLRHLADGVIEMRLDDEGELKRFLRIHTLKGLPHRTSWSPFAIEDTGKLVIQSEPSGQQ